LDKYQDQDLPPLSPDDLLAINHEDEDALDDSGLSDAEDGGADRVRGNGASEGKRRRQRGNGMAGADPEKGTDPESETDEDWDTGSGAEWGADAEWDADAGAEAAPHESLSDTQLTRLVFKYYQAALSTVLKKMDPEEKKEYEMRVKLARLKGLSDEDKKRYCPVIPYQYTSR
jgi:hypothetical protein